MRSVARPEGRGALAGLGLSASLLILAATLLTTSPEGVLGATAIDGPLPPDPIRFVVRDAAGTEGLTTCSEALGLVPLSEAKPASAAQSPPASRAALPPAQAGLPSAGILAAPLETLPAVSDTLSLPGADPDSLLLQPVEGSSDVLAEIRQVFRRGDDGARVRISFYGASHTASDWWTGAIRRTLQDRWGDLGRGFILPAALYRGYRGADVNVCRSEGWQADFIGKRDGSGDGLLGFSGMSVRSADPADFGWVETTHVNPHGRKVAWFDVYSLGHPGGGSFRATVDKSAPRVVTTKQTKQGLQVTRFAVPDGGHRLTLAPVGDGPVRFFGVSMERPGAGALVDTLGIRGRQARDWLRWNEQLLVEGWRSLSPDLVVLAYGTNEANDSNYSMEAYQSDLDAVLSKFRAGLPEVPCILVGPSDRGRKRRGEYSVWDRTAPIAQIQRETAPRYGCAFYDLQAATGGRGSMIAWRFTSPALAASDLIHFTKPGYEWLAKRFVAAIDSLKDDPRLRPR